MDEPQAVEMLIRNYSKLNDMVKEILKTLNDMHEALKTEQSNIIALDKKFERHVEDEEAHCVRNRGKLSPIASYRVKD